MTRYFADTWYFIALISPRDHDYRRALSLERMTSGLPLLTHDAVLTEFLTFFAEEGRVARERAVAMALQALRHESFQVLPADRPLFLAALDRYATRPDKGYSLVDCMSMAVMQQRGITHVLTNDHHFRQEGFVVVNDAP